MHSTSITSHQRRFRRRVRAMSAPNTSLRCVALVRQALSRLHPQLPSIFAYFLK
jgi:hypothetical protein